MSEKDLKVITVLAQLGMYKTPEPTPELQKIISDLEDTERQAKLAADEKFLQDVERIFKA